MRGSLRLFRAGIALALCLGTMGVALAFVDVPVAGAAVPTITTYSFKSGLPTGGTAVTITGTNLTGATVTFGAGNTAVASCTTAKCTIASTPAAPTSGANNCNATFPCTVPMTVTTTGGSASDPYYYENAPTVTNLISGSAPTTGGTTIIVIGTNLGGASAVHMNTTQAPAANVTQLSTTELSVVTIPLPAGSTSGTFYHLTVTTGSGTSATATANQFYWFGSGTCSFSGTGVVNPPAGGAPPGNSSYILDVTPTVQSTTGTTTAGSAILTDPSANFSQAADAGLGIIVNGANAAGQNLSTSILSVQSATQLTLATNAVVSLSGDATYAYGTFVGTTCSGLSGLALTTPFLESMSSPMAPVVTGTGPNGNGGNEIWGGWTGANGYSTDSGTSYTAPGVGYLFPFSSHTTQGTSGGCPLSAALCSSAAGTGNAPYFATDPGASCPPSQTQVDAGLIDCSVATVNADLAGNQYTASTLGVQYSNTPTPDPTTATFSTEGMASPIAPGATDTITGGVNFWGAGGEGSPGFASPIGATGVAAGIPAPAVFIGSTRDTAGIAGAVTSSVAVAPATYTCTGGGSYLYPTSEQGTPDAADNPASCTVGQGAVTGSFTVPASLAPGLYNVYIDEPNTTLEQNASFAGTTPYNVNNSTFTYSLVNAVESVTQICVGAVACSIGPVVSGVNPNQGKAGTTTPGVVITGTDFTGATAVTFGSTPATSFVVNSNTQITATAPSESAGTVDVRVTNGSESAITPLDEFTYLSTPTVTNVSPAQGPTGGSTPVTITGTNFAAPATVDFGANAATGVTVVNSTTITATSPAGSAGTVNVTVSTAGGTSTTSSADDFTYLSVPTVTNVSPGSGALGGGTPVTITGTNFASPATVDFGLIAATGVTVVNSTTITATSPAGTGTVDVRVTTGGGESPTNPPGDQFQYLSVPTVTGVSPNQGPTGGLAGITITGTGFSGATAVTFGATPASSYSVVNDTSITAHAPAGVAGTTVDVIVTNGVGPSSPNPPGDQFTWLGVPTVSNVTPNQGPTGGSTGVTITGTNFASPATVDFGANPATGVTVVNSTTITATSPSGSAGTINVTVATAGGTSATSSADDFTYLAQPTVTNVSPGQGVAGGGTGVTITGTNFASPATVAFGANAATGVSVVNSTTITATSPSGTGTVDVRVTTGGGESPVNAPGDQFNYETPATVTNVSPNQGPLGGIGVTITGNGFLIGSTVAFGTTPATGVTVVNSTTITATAPPESAGTVDVHVNNGFGNSSANPPGDQFTYLPVPTVTNVSPNTGPASGGTGVTITGTGFASPVAVDFSGIPAMGTTIVVNSTTITATSPAGTGVADVEVTTNGGSSVANPGDEFTYVSTPSVTSVSPNQGPLGGLSGVTITGTNFVTGATVSFGGNAGTGVDVVSGTSITVNAPPGSAGTVDVRVTTTGGESPVNPPGDQFTYVAAPTVTNVNPNQGPLGGLAGITITGTNLTAATAVNFGGNPASSYTVNSASSITAHAPAGSAGTVDVTVVTAGGTSATSPADHFTYLAAPTVTGIAPNNGPEAGGTGVTITGTGFVTGATVSFGVTAGSGVVVNSATSISVTSPAGIGTADVTVQTPGGSSATSLADEFMWNPPPTVTNVSPNNGSAAGGTSVTITGTNFTSGATVSFGGNGGTGVVVNSATSISATSPAGSGTVDVRVTTTGGGTSATSSADHFTYNPLPVVTGVSPNSGPPGGGTVVTITGSGFTGATAVSFGGNAALIRTPAPRFTVNSATSITATSPAGSGTVNVTVTTPVGTSATSGADQFSYVTPSSITGYWLVASDGGVFTFGRIPFWGSLAGTPLGTGVVGIASTPGAKGYWLATSMGGVFPFGNARMFGTASSPTAPIVGIAATTDGGGYWLVGSDGNVYPFGDAQGFGSMAGKHLDSPVEGIATTPDGKGYWLVASDGGMFSFGDAHYFGSMGGKSLNAPVVGMASTNDGQGYWLVASDGGMFSFGDARFYGSMGGKPLNSPIAAMNPA